MESLAQIFDNFSEKTIDDHPFFFCFDCIEPIHTDRPFQCKNVILPSAFFLYMKSGRITLEIHSRDHTSHTKELTEGDIVFLYPDTFFSLSSDAAVTDFILLALHGVLLQDYLLSSHHSDRYYVLDNYLPILSNQIEHIEADFTSDLMAHCSTEKRIFFMQQYATDLMTYFRQSLVLPANQMSRSVPSYLKKVRRHLDEHYALTFVLDDVVEWYGVSKYKFCHDFKEFYGQPPLQYLNEQRILHAKDFLLSTNVPVHEVGSMVGIDNTNHFITLFKRCTGVTPLQYRREHLSID